MIGQLSDGRYFKAADIIEISREEFEIRLQHAEETGRALPLEWTPPRKEDYRDDA